MLPPSLGLLAGLAAGVSACAPLSSPGRLTPLALADSFARAAAQQETSLDPRTFPALSVAVPPLRAITRDTALAVLGYGLADLIMTDLARSAQLRVVDRLRLDAVLREQQLASSGRVDSATAPRTGRLVGARTLVLGDVVEGAGGALRVATRVVDVVDASIGSGPAANSAVDGILDAQKQLVFALFDRLGVTLTPRERALVAERPTQNLAALLAYSRGVRAQVQGDMRAAQSEFRAASALDRGFRQARERASQSAAAVGEPVADAATRLAPIADLSTNLVNRPSVPIRNDVADPTFANARRLASLVISAIIP